MGLNVLVGLAIGVISMWAIVGSNAQHIGGRVGMPRLENPPKTAAAATCPCYAASNMIFAWDSCLPSTPGKNVNVTSFVLVTCDSGSVATTWTSLNNIDGECSVTVDTFNVPSLAGTSETGLTAAEDQACDDANAAFDAARP